MIALLVMHFAIISVANLNLSAEISVELKIVSLNYY